VIAGGRLSSPIPVEEATIEQIGLVMGGAAAKDLDGAAAERQG